MQKIGGYIFTQVTDAKVRKALALYIYVKNKYPTSTITNFTYKQFTKETGLCYTALKKRIKTLDGLELLQRVGKDNRHLLFKSCKKRHFNVNIGKIDLTSLRTIEDSLCALYIVLVQQRKEYVRQLLATYNYWRNSDKKYIPKSVNFKRLDKFVRKRGYDDIYFTDNGLSYFYLANKLHVSYTRVSNSIKTGERQGMFTKRTHIHVLKRPKVNGHFDYKFMPKAKNSYATDKGIYIIYANTYHLPTSNDGMA